MAELHLKVSLAWGQCGEWIRVIPGWDTLPVNQTRNELN